MFTYIIHRILLMFPTLIGITLVVFAVMALSPGGITPTQLIDGNLKPQERQALINYYNKRYGLDQPAPIQYLRWLNNISPIGFTSNEKGEYVGFSLFKGTDLGVSFHYGRGVGEILLERLPITILLNVLSIPIVYILAIFLGIHAARNRGGVFDKYSNVSMLALWSLPTILTGVLLLGFFANVQHWHWFPTAGIHSRQALDMTFLPTGLTLVEILILTLLIFLALFLGGLLGKLANTHLRRNISIIIAIVTGITIGNLHQDLPIIFYFLITLVLALIYWGVSLFNNRQIRITIYSLIFITYLILIFFTFWGKDFQSGYLLDSLWHLILPIICMSYGGFAGLAKLTRTSILENLNADYVRTARAKGLSEDQVFWKHIFNNSLLPLITVSAGLLPSLLAGSLIVENIFSINGMGQLVVEAVKNRDRELVLSITWISGLLTLFGYLIADFLYTLADPRVNYD